MLGGSYVPIKWQHKNQGRNQFLGEWLYDVLWWHENDQGYAIDIPLVAESEWGGPGKFQDDFQKLLLARSKYKVIVLPIENYTFNRMFNYKFMIYNDKYQFSLSHV